MRLWVITILTISTAYCQDHNEQTLHNTLTQQDLVYINSLRQAVYRHGKCLDIIKKKRNDHNIQNAIAGWETFTQHVNNQLDTLAIETNERYVGEDLNELETQCREYGAASQIMAEALCAQYTSHHLHTTHIARSTFGTPTHNTTESKLLTYAYMIGQIRIMRDWVKQQHINHIINSANNVNVEQIKQKRNEAEKHIKDFYTKLRKNIHPNTSSESSWLHAYRNHVAYNLSDGYTDDNNVFHRWDQQYNTIVNKTTQLATLLHLDTSGNFVPFDTQSSALVSISKPSQNTLFNT